MKVLFVSFFQGRLNSGGTVCSNRNLKSLKELYGAENVVLYSIMRSQPKENENKLLWSIKNIFIDIVELGFGGLDRNSKKEIVTKVTELGIGTVFIDSSLLGVLSKKIKKTFPKVKIISFFHNVECSFFAQNIFHEKKYALSYRILLAYLSERLICKYSERIIALNKRDERKISSIYGRTPDLLIPISMINSYNHERDIVQLSGGKKIALFVGSFFFSNIDGITWFIMNVLPSTDIKLIVVGNGMEQLKELISKKYLSYVDIYSYVPQLSEYYEQADFVILPIFSGGGMKVKTAEALMYGKFLIGTKEAFMGYEINQNVGICCETVSDMIAAIDKCRERSKYNKASKELFLNNYSYESTLNKFKQLIA